jgi:hypothetical protein
LSPVQPSNSTFGRDVNRRSLLSWLALAVIGCWIATGIASAEPVATQSIARARTAPPPPARPAVGIVAIGFDAWAGADPAALSRATDFAVFHAPEPGPDDRARRAYEAADPTSDSFVYQNFGFSCERESWTTCGFTTRQAHARGFLARYNGREVVLDGVRRAVDAGQRGYGLAVARAFAARLAALSPRPDGVFIDDANVLDERLPKNGVPDGYTLDEYREAVKAQLTAAVAELNRIGYRTMANVGGVHLGEYELAGVADFTFLEFCGTAENVRSRFDPAARDVGVAARWIEAAITLTRWRRGRSICQFFGGAQAGRRLTSGVLAVLGADGIALAGGPDYRAPFAIVPRPADDLRRFLGPTG